MTENSRTIDVHTHIMPPRWEDFASRFGIAGWPWVKQHSTCSATIMLGEREFRHVTSRARSNVAPREMRRQSASLRHETPQCR